MRSLLLRQARKVASIILPPPPWSPLSLSPFVWVDAQVASSITQSSGLVSQWDDLGANGNDLQGEGFTRPSYSATALNGLPGLEVIDPATGRMAVAPSSFGGLTDKMSVFAAASANVNSGGPLVGWGSFFAQSSYSSSLYANVIGHGSVVEDVYAYRNNSFRGRKAIVRDTARIIGSVFDGTNHTMYVDGTAGTAVASTGNFSVDEYTYLSILGNYDTSPGYWRGALGELIVLIGDVSTENRQRIEGYMAHRWLTTANLPEDHPYKTSPP